MQPQPPEPSNSKIPPATAPFPTQSFLLLYPSHEVYLQSCHLYSNSSMI